MQKLAVFLWCVVSLVLAGCASSTAARLHTAPLGTPHELRTIANPPPRAADRAKTAPAQSQIVLPSEPVIAPSPSDSPPVTRPSVQNPTSPPAAVTPVPQTQAVRDHWISLTVWAQENGVTVPVQGASDPIPAYELRSTNGTLVLRPGMSIAAWNASIGGQPLSTTAIWLGYAPRLSEGQVLMHSADLRATAQPLLLRIPGPLAFSRADRPLKVMLDPGHGGVNSGTRSALGEEKDYTLDWALRTGDLLRQQGWEVLLTRSSDRDLSLGDRVLLSNESEADLFVSLHFNSAGHQERHEGIETYTLTPVGLPSSITREFPDDPAAQFPNNAFDPQNLLLAVRVHQALLAQTGALDRGVRHARFMGVLRNQQRPAILVEAGYLSNTSEARRIHDANYRQKLAVGLAQALLGRPLDKQ